MATSVGGVLTGFGADIIVVDDPMKPDQAYSVVERVKANNWFSHTLVSRINDKNTGAIVVIMQRLHEDDFVGYIQTLDTWRSCPSPPSPSAMSAGRSPLPSERMFTGVRRVRRCIRRARTLRCSHSFAAASARRTSTPSTSKGRCRPTAA